jgi:hypothetical protein
MTYKLTVAPSVFRDGKYTLYASSDDNPDVQHQIRGRFAEMDDALAFAGHVLAVAPESFHDQAGVGQSPEGNLRPNTDEGADTIAAQLYGLAETDRSAAWSRFMDGLPILFAMMLLAYLAWTAIFGGEAAFRRSVALFAPVGLAVLVLSNWARAELRSRRYKEECALVVELVLAHGWRREDLFPLLVALEHPGKRALPLFLYSGWLYDVVPRGFEQVGLDFMYRRPEGQWGPEDAHDLADWLREEDFEARIQALVTLRKQDGPIRFSALRCLATSRRGVRRARALVAEGISAVAYLDTAALPGFDDDKVRGRYAWFLVFLSPTVHAAALGWCFLVQHWPGLAGILGMGATLAASTIPIIMWNRTLVSKLGLPKAFSWEDLQGDMLLVRGI